MGLRLTRTPGTRASPPDTSPPGRAALTGILSGEASGRGTALGDRIATLLAALETSPAGSDRADLLPALEAALHDPGPEEVWLALAVITGRLPDVPAVQRTLRAIRLDGPLPSLVTALGESGQLRATAWPEVEVVTGQVLVDLHHTAQNLFSTGIQRVARETARRWIQQRQTILVGWAEGYAHLRRLSAVEVDRAFRGSADMVASAAPAGAVLVPWKCTHLVAELPVEPVRTSHYQAFVRFSGSVTGLVGHDCVPIMAAETTAEAMPVGFAHYLAFAAHVDRIATTCGAAELEYRGWRTMLAGTGLSGPDIACVPLPVHADTPSDAALHQAHDLLAVGTLPIILTVGSHEPRKNHLALLHAAELLWREGLLFTLVFVGGHSWNSAAFDNRIEALRGAGRPVQTIRALPDDLLWAAYRHAYCTVFASLHEGYGLPVAESLASGTPVITSNFGSMRELAGHGGALLVDPRQDHQLADALRQLLLDRPLRDRLAAQAATIPRRTWDDYAADTWNYLVNGTPPPTMGR